MKIESGEITAEVRIYHLSQAANGNTSNNELQAVPAGHWWWTVGAGTISSG